MIADKFTSAGADPLRENRRRAEAIARRYGVTSGSLPRQDDRVDRFAATVRDMQPDNPTWQSMTENDRLDWATRLAAHFVTGRDGAVREAAAQPVRLIPEHKNVFRARMEFNDGKLELRMKQSAMGYAEFTAEALVEAAAVYSAERQAGHVIQRRMDRMVEESLTLVHPAAFEPTDLELYIRQPVPAAAASMAANALGRPVEKLVLDRHYAFRQQATIDRLTAYDLHGHDTAVFAMQTIDAPGGGDDNEALLTFDNMTKAHLVHAINRSDWLDDDNKRYYTHRVIEVAEVSRDAADGFEAMITRADPARFDGALLNTGTIAAWQALMENPEAGRTGIKAIANAIAKGVSQVYDIRSDYRVVLYNDPQDGTIGGGRYNTDDKVCEIYLNLAAPEMHDLPAAAFVISHELSHAAVQEAIALSVHPSPHTRNGRHAALFEFIQLHNPKNYIYPEESAQGYMVQPEEALANILGFRMSHKLCRDVLGYDPSYKDYKAITETIDVGTSALCLADMKIVAPDHISLAPLLPETGQDDPAEVPQGYHLLRQLRRGLGL